MTEYWKKWKRKNSVVINSCIGGTPDKCFRNGLSINKNLTKNEWENITQDEIEKNWEITNEDEQMLHELFVIVERGQKELTDNADDFESDEFEKDINEQFRKKEKENKEIKHNIIEKFSKDSIKFPMKIKLKGK